MRKILGEKDQIFSKILKKEIHSFPRFYAAYCSTINIVEMNAEWLAEAFYSIVGF